MKRRAAIPLLFGLLLLGNKQLFAEESSQIVNMRYYNHEGSSRLAIKLLGNPQYSTERNESDVRIILPNTDVPASYDGARMHFANGFVTRVYVDRWKGDCVVVTVGLKANTGFRVERMDNMEGVFIDVFPDSSRTLTQDSGDADTALATGHRSVILPIQTLSFTTLVAADNMPPKKQKDSVVSAAPPAVSIVLPNISFAWPKVGVVHVSLAIALAVLGTALVLLVIRRLYVTRNVRVPSTFTAEFAGAISGHPDQRKEDSREMWSSRPVESPRNRLVEEDSSVRMLAKRYGRGLGEVKLSFDLRSRMSERRWIARVQELAEKNEQLQDRLAVAKELGIGRGEVDLAVLLHHSKTPKTLKGELA